MPPREVTVRPHAGGGLGVHGGDQLRRRMRSEHPVGVDRLPPLVVHPHDLGPAPRGDVDHALPEQPVDRDDDHVAGAHGVDERGLHAGRAGRRQRERAPVRRPEDLPQPVGGLVQDLQELGVEVPEQRLPEGDRGLRVGVRRAGSEQGAGTQRHARDATGAARRPSSAPAPGAPAPHSRHTGPGPRRRSRSSAWGDRSR
jgi:hypothetical protein